MRNKPLTDAEEQAMREAWFKLDTGAYPTLGPTAPGTAASVRAMMKMFDCRFKDVARVIFDDKFLASVKGT